MTWVCSYTSCDGTVQVRAHVVVTVDGSVEATQPSARELAMMRLLTMMNKTLVAAQQTNVKQEGVIVTQGEKIAKQGEKITTLEVLLAKLEAVMSTKQNATDALLTTVAQEQAVALNASTHALDSALLEIREQDLGREKRVAAVEAKIDNAVRGCS